MLCAVLQGSAVFAPDRRSALRYGVEVLIPVTMREPRL